MTRWTLTTLETPDGPMAAIACAGRHYPVATLLPDFAGDDAKALLRSWDTASDAIDAAMAEIAAGNLAAPAIAEADTTLLTPILYPDALLAVGANYSGHLKEMGLEAEKWASMPFFMRPPKTSLVGPGATVRIPRSTQQFDWECELAVVVGKRLRHADRSQAAAAIAGYSIGLDLSCRDLIPAGNDLQIDLVRGKAQDTMAPCGPAMVPVRFVPDVDDLRITLSVNDEPMIDASTSEMLYKVDEQLSVISDYVTLMPGDILFTGSPSGSAGVHGDRWLRDGDRIRAEIERIGILEVSVHDDV